MEDKLADLSQSLSDAFAETIARTQDLPEGYSRLGIDSLMWLTHAARPQTISELGDTVAIQRGQHAIKIKYRPHENLIIECCQGLATIDAEGHIRVAHHAIQQYLEDHSETLFPRAKETMALNCLQYLLFEDFEDGPWQTKDEIDAHMQSYPFLEYAARYWGEHTREVERDSEVQSMLSRFLACRTAMATANQVRQYSLGRRHKYWNAAECESFGPLHHASRHGLQHTMGRLLENGLYHVNELTKMASTPIIHAAAGGHIQTVRKLLEHGADPYLQNWYGNALHCAVEAGKSGAIRELVSWGMNPNEPMGHRPFLGCTLDRDSVDAFETLVELGADIQTQYVEPGIHIFFSACGWDCEKIMRLMMERGWVDIQMRTPAGQSTLHWAAAGSSLETVERLIAAGVQINALDNGGRSPLDIARYAANEAVIRLLEASGARSGRDIKSEDSRVSISP